MSSKNDALLVVRFGDGTFRYGCFMGNANVACRKLLEHLAGWQFLPRRAMGDRSKGESVEQVQVATSSGGGLWWEGQATRTHLLTYAPFGIEGVGDRVIASPVPVHDGLPEWWPLEEVRL